MASHTRWYLRGGNRNWWEGSKCTNEPNSNVASCRHCCSLRVRRWIIAANIIEYMHCWISRAFAVAAFPCSLVSRVALALEGAFGVATATVSTQPDVLTLINVCWWKAKAVRMRNVDDATSPSIPCRIHGTESLLSHSGAKWEIVESRLEENVALLTTATFAVWCWEEALVAQAAVGPWEVLAAPVRTDARLLTLVNVWRNVLKQTKDGSYEQWCNNTFGRRFFCSLLVWSAHYCFAWEAQLKPGLLTFGMIMMN